MDKDKIMEIVEKAIKFRKMKAEAEAELDNLRIQAWNMLMDSLKKVLEDKFKEATSGLIFDVIITINGLTVMIRPLLSAVTVIPPPITIAPYIETPKIEGHKLYLKGKQFDLIHDALKKLGFKIACIRDNEIEYILNVCNNS